MTTFRKIVRYMLRDQLRSRWLVGYAAILALATDALLRFSAAPEQAGLSLVSVVLFVVPLVSLVVGTMVVYAGREFTELLLAQPIRRGQLFLAQYVGIALPLSVALVLGIGIPFLLHGVAGTGGRALAALIGAGIALTWIFTAIAQLLAVRCEDRVKGLAGAIAIWISATMLYDGLVLAVAAGFHAYPIERPMIGLLLANPVDLARLTLLLEFDAAALMGYTGAIFRSVFGSTLGAGLAIGALLLWVTTPLALGARAFARKDF